MFTFCGYEYWRWYRFTITDELTTFEAVSKQKIAVNIWFLKPWSSQSKIVFVKFQPRLPNASSKRQVRWNCFRGAFFTSLFVCYGSLYEWFASESGIISMSLRSVKLLSRSLSPHVDTRFVQPEKLNKHCFFPLNVCFICVTGGGRADGQLPSGEHCNIQKMSHLIGRPYGPYGLVRTFPLTGLVLT